MTKKVVVIGTVGIPANYGGFESLVENLTKNKSSDFEYYVFCSSFSYETKLEYHNDARLIYLPIKANGIQSVFYDIVSLWKSVFLKPDVVVVLGVSGCLFLPVYRLLSNSKIVTNIDGLEWRRDKWGKLAKMFLKLSERFAIRYSDVIITDNQAITEYVKDEYSIHSVTIAYGGDHALRNVGFSAKSQNYALGLCRIEPENNVAMILEAFSKSTKKIKFIGNWDNSEFGRKLKKKYSRFENIEILNPIYELNELYKIRMGASIYVHGHSAGGTNPSLVEMMHFEKPILAFDCSFNRYSTHNKAHYFSSVDELSKLLSEMSSEDLVFNSKEMCRIARDNYTWDEITRKYECEY